MYSSIESAGQRSSTLIRNSSAYERSIKNRRSPKMNKNGDLNYDRC